MFLNVIPDFTPLPAIRGLGNARMIALPPRGFGSRRRGMGQTQGCPETAFDGQMESWLSSLSAESQADAAVGCGAGAPCASPADASQMALLIAQNYCNVVADGAQFGCPPDSACNDIPTSAAPYVARALAFFQSFPASVWTQEAANLKSGNYYGTDTDVNAQWNYNAGVAPVLTYAEANAGNTTGSPLSQTGTVIAAKTDSSAPSNTSQPTGSVQTTTGPIATTAAAASVAAPDPFAFLTESMIGGIPNWGLILAGVAALFLLGGKR